MCSCKPAIRRTVKAGDWIFGISSGTEKVRHVVFGMYVLRTLTLREAYEAFPFKRADARERRKGDIQLGPDGGYLPFADHRCCSGCGDREEMEKDRQGRCPVGVLGPHPDSNILVERGELTKCQSFDWLGRQPDDDEYSYYWGADGLVFDQKAYRRIRIPQWMSPHVEGMLRQGHRVIRWEHERSVGHKKSKKLLNLINRTVRRVGYSPISLEPGFL